MRRLFATILAAAATAAAQTGPITTPQVNKDLYVGQVQGFYPTIQSAVTKACSLTAGARVVVPLGVSGSDLPQNATGGCTKAPIVDQRVIPELFYKWSGTAYVAQNPAMPAGTPGAMQYNNAGTLGGLNGSGIPKLNGTSAPSIAVPGTDYQAPGSYITALSGDGTATGPGSAVFTLSTVNSTPGACGDASHICSVTTDNKGRVIAQAAYNVTIPQILPIAVAGPTPTSNAWLYSLTNYPNQVVNVVIYADSYARCDQNNCGLGGGPVQPTNRWPEQVRIYGQNQYGSNGTGLVPIVHIASGTAQADQDAYTVTGTYDTSNYSLGPTQFNASGSLFHFTSGSVTYNDSRALPWSKLAIYYATSGTTGDISVSIDGVSVGTANAGNATASGYTNGGLTAQRKDFTVTRGVHVVTASCSNCYIYGFQGIDGSSGLSVHNLAIGGATADMYGTNTNAQLAFAALIPGGHQAAMISFLTNDSAYGNGTANFSTKLTNIVTYERALSSAPSVMIGVPPVSVINGSIPEAPYTAVLVERCTTLSLTCRNIQDRWGTAYVAARFDQTSAAWPTGNAGVHPNDNGSRDEGAEYAAMLFNPATSSGTGGCTDTCTFTGTTTLNSGANQNTLIMTSTHAAGPFFLLGGTATGIHNWGFQSGLGAGSASGDSQFQVGDFTTGVYSLVQKVAADGSGYVAFGQPMVVGWNSVFSANNNRPDAAFSRAGANAVACGNGTQGNASCAFSAGSFTGQSATLSGGSSQTVLTMSSTHAAGPFFLLGGTATGIHNWGFQSGLGGGTATGDSQFQVGDFSTGLYALATRISAGGAGYAVVGGQMALGFSSDTTTWSANNGRPDAAFSRSGANGIACGNGTVGNATCTFSAGTLAIAGGSSGNAATFSSTNTAGTTVKILGTATGIHTWGLQSGLGGTDSQFQLGDFTTGIYALSSKAAADGSGYLRLPSLQVVGFSSTADVTTAAVDTGISRLGAASFAMGNGTQGNTSATLTLATLKSTSLFASGLGSSTSPLCTTTGGQLTNSGCTGTDPANYFYVIGNVVTSGATVGSGLCTSVATIAPMPSWFDSTSGVTVTYATDPNSVGAIGITLYPINDGTPGSVKIRACNASASTITLTGDLHYNVNVSHGYIAP